MEVFAPNQAIYGLPLMTFRGLRAPPYDIANFAFSHSQAEARFPYRSGARHDWTGLDPIPLDFKLYFVNTLEPQAFPELWEKWRAALFDGAPGVLRHPLLGIMDVVVMSGDVSLVAQVTAGIVVGVKFSQTVIDLDDEKPIAGAEVAIAQLATQADEWGAAVGISFPSGETATSFEDLIGQITSAIGLAKMQALGLITQAMGIVQDVAKAVADLQSHVTWPYTAVLGKLFSGLLDLRDTLGVTVSRVTKTVFYNYDTTIDAVAADQGNSVKDVMSLNLTLLRSPIIPAGTTVKVYA